MHCHHINQFTKDTCPSHHDLYSLLCVSSSLKILIAPLCPSQILSSPWWNYVRYILYIPSWLHWDYLSMQYHHITGNQVTKDTCHHDLYSLHCLHLSYFKLYRTSVSQPSMTVSLSHPVTVISQWLSQSEPMMIYVRVHDELHTKYSNDSDIPKDICEYNISISIRLLKILVIMICIAYIVCLHLTIYSVMIALGLSVNSLSSYKISLLKVLQVVIMICIVYSVCLHLSYLYCTSVSQPSMIVSLSHPVTVIMISPWLSHHSGGSEQMLSSICAGLQQMCVCSAQAVLRGLGRSQISLTASEQSHQTAFEDFPPLAAY